MPKLVGKKELGQDVYRLVVDAPQIARKRRAGQFVIVQLGGDAERIPLTIADADPEAGTISLIVQAVGQSTSRLCRLEAGDEIPAVAGPLGLPTHLPDEGHAVCVGGGVGTAVVYPIAAALAKKNCRVTAILGGRTKSLVLLEEEMKRLCDEVIVTTDDGSYGRKGFVTDALKDLLERNGDPIRTVYAVGPVPMMKAVTKVTAPANVSTIVSLNPIMIDGTGMCGGCRVTVDGKTKFACVDGPEFDGHKVDFDELADRLSTYRNHEEKCKLGLQ